MRKKYAFLAAMCFLFAGRAFLSAQTAAELEAVLGTSALSCAQAARFVIASSGPLDAEAGDGSGAFTQALGKGWFPRGTGADEPISMGKLSFLLMKAFGINGGLMYRIFPGPRYAYRAMVSQFYIQGASDPDMKVSGDNFLNILGRVLGEYGGES